MQPLWISAADVDVANGTHLGAESATYAGIGIDSEFLVGNHLLVEIVAYDIAEEPRCRTFYDVAYAGSAVFYQFLVDEDVGGSFLTFLPFVLNGVGVHERQCHIAFGHDEAKASVEMKVFAVKFLGENIHCFPYTVAASGESVAEMVSIGGQP